tara:strand:- start:2468 stop:2833 length:366 start_codon:yes stop_codon:yes gene_type:complete
MTKVGITIARSFLKGVPKRMGNTKTNGEDLFLFGNVIAWKTDKETFPPRVIITLAGWPSKSTRDRLNCLLWEMYKPKQKGIDSTRVALIYQKEGLQYFKDFNESWEQATLIDKYDEIELRP